MYDASKLPDDVSKSVDSLLKMVQSEPPTIGLVGVSGVGKSSTLNRIFKTKFRTSDNVAGTKEFERAEVELSFTKGAAEGSRIPLVVVDAPGLGEDVRADLTYLNEYHKHLAKCDVILWVMAARNRAIALDQQYLNELRSFHSKMVFGLNQVDLLEPMNWSQLNIPSTEQEVNIQIIVDDRQNRLEHVIGNRPTIVPYSSRTGFGIAELFLQIVSAIPADRAWMFESLQGFDINEIFAAFRDKQSGNGKISSTKEDGCLSGLIKLLGFGSGK